MHVTDFKEMEKMGMQDLFFTANRCSMELRFCMLSELEIHPGQIPVLMILSAKDGISQKELAEFLRIKPPTVTTTVQRLEKNGIVVRKQDEKDQRVSRTFLTEKGRSIIGGAKGRIREMEAMIFDGFSETELCLMRRFFIQMIRNMETISGTLKQDCKYVRNEGFDKC